MQTEEQLKTVVREKYTEIASQSREQNLVSCCGSGPSSCCSPTSDTIMADDYSTVSGYVSDADLGLGCGLPTQFAQIEPGDTVIDLGSGAGNDCFVARYETGPTGKVIGIDFTDAMISRARQNAEKLGFNNVEFRFGDIEHMPVNDNTSDVIVSNCVLNLVPNKRNVFGEIYRTLKPGGHFSISDIVLTGELPGCLREVAELYAGCVSGAIQKSEYLGFIQEAGFENVTLQKEKPIFLPDDILGAYLSEVEIADFRQSGASIQSITVYAVKPVSPTLISSQPAEAVQETKTGCCDPTCCK